MAYGLPARGQADWDDELNNSLEALKATSDSAEAKANVAVSTAIAAQNTAQAAQAALANVETSAGAQAKVDALAGTLPGAYVRRMDTATYTYNPDGTIATETVAGKTTTYAWNADGTLHTATRDGVTLTYNYDASTGNLTAVS